ncbi:hypothetical protein QFC20_006718 [Naganishia adeliensis]|uniref:Uncharacterized protein n=1 Tax=Naganishia adeliensis TaxID=92952 RepID=A0ACC2V7M9_9TREE|nr:hypothetical protein QFC20_006718 [Naganishia adeliensis]
MSSREQIKQSCLTSIRSVQGAEKLFLGKLEDSLDIFLNAYEPNFFAFVKEKLPNRSPEQKYATGMIICQLLYDPLSKDDPDDVQFSPDARFWKRYEPCNSNLELQEVDTKLLDLGKSSLRLLAEMQMQHPLAQRHPVRYQYVKQILMDLGVTKIKTSFKALGEWESDRQAEVTASMEEGSMASHKTPHATVETDGSPQEDGSRQSTISFPAPTEPSSAGTSPSQWVHIFNPGPTLQDLRDRTR